MVTEVQQAAAGPVAEGADVTGKESALKTLNMTEEEYTRVLSPSADWPHAGSEDGWMKAHNALRKNMDDMAGALQAIVQRLEAGEPVQPWMVKNLQQWWPSYEHIVHHHHHNEEAIAFPVLAKLVEIPPKMSSDHVTLLQDMSDFGKMIAALQPGQEVTDDLKTYIALRDKFQAMKASMEEHLLEEDMVGLPLLRKTMTYKQFQPTEKKILGSMSTADMGWFFNAFPSDETRTEWMTSVAKIPGFAQKLILLPASAKYEKKVRGLLVEVTNGQKAVEPRRAMFSCFAA